MISYILIVNRGGYDQRETLEALDSLNTRICLLYDEIDKKKRNKVFDVPRWAPVKMPRKVARDGYDERDIDELITELRSYAIELEKELLS